MPIFHFVGAFVVMSLGLGSYASASEMDDGNSVTLLRQLTTNILGHPLRNHRRNTCRRIDLPCWYLAPFTKAHWQHWRLHPLLLLFAIVHGNLQQGVPAFILGFALAYLYVRTEDLRLCWAAHLANNVIALLTIRIPALEHFGDSWSTSQQRALAH